MARKKPKPDGERPKRHPKPPAADPGPAEPRSVEGTMRRLADASGAGGDEASPSSKAEALLARA